MKISLLQSFYIKQIIKLCRRNKIDHIVSRDSDTNRCEYITIFCSNFEYNEFLRNNFYIKHSKFVYMNVYSAPLWFVINQGG